ncbi:hypothetical protein Plhal703r1_c61g0165471 [Plasmopara halstedii]
MNRIRRYREPEVDEVAPKDDRIDVIMKELEFLRSELAQKNVESSISKYFKEEIFTKDRGTLFKDGFVSKGDYLEIPLTLLNARYKQWCIDTGHNRIFIVDILTLINTCTNQVLQQASYSKLLHSNIFKIDIIGLIGTISVYRFMKLYIFNTTSIIGIG